MLRRADLHESNHQLESRVREIRLPGSEGGAILISRPYPYLIHSAIRIPIQIVSRTKLKTAIRPAPLSRILSSNSGLNNESVELRASPGK